MATGDLKLFHRSWSLDHAQNLSAIQRKTFALFSRSKLVSVKITGITCDTREAPKKHKDCELSLWSDLSFSLSGNRKCWRPREQPRSQGFSLWFDQRELSSLTSAVSDQWRAKIADDGQLSQGLWEFVTSVTRKVRSSEKLDFFPIEVSEERLHSDICLLLAVTNVEGQQASHPIFLFRLKKCCLKVLTRKRNQLEKNVELCISCCFLFYWDREMFPSCTITFSAVYTLVEFLHRITSFQQIHHWIPQR